MLLNEKLQRTDEEGNKFKTSSGVDIDADLVFWCTGISMSTGFLRPALEESLDEQGRVKVGGPGHKAQRWARPLGLLACV